MSEDRSAAERACLHIVRQIQIDGRLAYLIGPHSQSYELVTEAVAGVTGEAVEDCRRRIEQNLHPVRIEEVPA